MKELTVAKRAAREAGKVLLWHFGRLDRLRYKAKRDPVSEADRESEALIAGIIKKEFPGHGFLAEENTAWKGETGERWLVDPLDGTVNYAHTYPCFCVSIAYEREGEMQAGVVYDPVRKEMFHAVRGGGAYLNDKPIHVTDRAKLIKSLIVTGFPYDIERRPEIPRLFNRMLLAAEGVRRDGSAALDLCYVACGRFDGFWEFELKPWDTAAGALIVREAGGVVTDFAGRPFRPEMKQILASNGKIHKEMRKVVRPQ